MMKNALWAKMAAIVLAWVCLVPGIAQAELTLAAPFTDNAVLQQKMPVPIWGKADPDATVTVAFAGQKKTAIAGSTGAWRVTLEPLQASAKPFELSVASSAGNETVVLRNVLVGEVWICSGQSNMQMGVSAVPAVKALAPASKNIRNFTVKQTVAFTEQADCSGQWVTQHPGSAVAFAFASFLEKNANVPVGIIQSCWGSSSIEGWMPRDMTEKLPHFKKQMRDFDADQQKRTRIHSILNGKKPWGRQNDIFLRTQPNVIYNAMMHPLAPLACRGIVWYQGEANGNNIPSMLQYGKTLPAWIQRYRDLWGRDDLHFLLVMLPGYAKGLKEQAAHPSAHSWAWMRESQMKALALPHTSVANTIDLGDANNIHPKDKLPVGKRLALLAAHDVLKMDIAAQGPVLKRVESTKDGLVVHFNHAKELKTRDGKPPAGFWLADDSKKWVKADAKLNGNTVILTSSQLAEPLYIRYAFAGKPDVNLVNQVGLPAIPFRTDKFKP